MPNSRASASRAIGAPAIEKEVVGALANAIVAFGVGPP